MTRAFAAILTGIALVFVLAAAFYPPAIDAFVGASL